MKGRLIVQERLSVPYPMSVCWLPEGTPIPPGWEALEVVEESQAGAHPEDLCLCGHSRIHHIARKNGCLMLKPLPADGPCGCQKFQEPG